MTIIWPGTPGESFANDTDKILYQLICTWSNTCGTCGQYHLAIAKWWPKFHQGCNCISTPVYPGQKSAPYEDWREIVKDLEPDQQVKLVGKSNYRLIEEGVVKWEDVVTSSRVRSLQEVVSRGNLTVDQLTDAGVRRDIAERAWGAVNTPEHLIIEQRRADLVRRIQELGVQPRHLAEMFGEEMARRIGIGAGPSGAGVMPPTSNYRSLDDWVRLIVAGGIPGDLGARLEAARRLPETTPAGEKVSDALDVRIEGDEGRLVRDVLATIDSVHGAGDLPRLPIESMQGGYLGRVRLSAGGRAIAIDLNPSGDDQPRLSATHEIGHYLDFEGIPLGAGYYGGRKFAEDPLFADWYAAVHGSEAVARLKAARDAGSVTVDGTAYVVQPKYAGYLLEDRELWARTYAQYVALRGTDPAMKAEVREMLDGTHNRIYGDAWDERDFRPIADAIDGIFAKLGWTKPQ